MVTSTGSRGVRDTNRRDNGRIAVGSVRSSAGVILDASAGGLRVRGSLPKSAAPGQVMPLSVESEEGDRRVDLEAEIRWIQRHRFRGATFGVAFVAIDDEQRSQLFSIIRTSKIAARCQWNHPAA